MNILTNAAPTVKSTDYALLVAFEQFQLGWDRFTAREPLAECTSSEQRRGWNAALNASSVASLPAGCADRLGW